MDFSRDLSSIKYFAGLTISFKVFSSANSLLFFCVFVGTSDQRKYNFYGLIFIETSVFKIYFVVDNNIEFELVNLSRQSICHIPF